MSGLVKGVAAYILRSSKTEDPSQALDRAIQWWNVLVPLIKAGASTETLSMQAAVHQYLNTSRSVLMLVRSRAMLCEIAEFN